MAVRRFAGRAIVRQVGALVWEKARACITGAA
jgi:hypothetical protein